MPTLSEVKEALTLADAWFDKNTVERVDDIRVIVYLRLRKLEKSLGDKSEKMQRRLPML